MLKAFVERMEWRICVGFPDYEVSEYGDVKRATAARTRKKGHRLRGYINSDGYIAYSLCAVDGTKHARPAHYLVAVTFIGASPSEDHEVAHNNGSRIACHHSNLRWALRKENHDDMQLHGTAVKGIANGRAKISDGDVHQIRLEYRRIKNRDSDVKVSSLAKHYGIHHATLVDIATGRTWSHIPMNLEVA
jgi:hypothetical protein